MEIKEAIEMLHEIINIIPVSKNVKHQDERYDALDKAIEALEKQLNND